MDAPRPAPARLPIALVAVALVVVAVAVVALGGALRAGNPARDASTGRLAVVDAAGGLSIVDGSGRRIVALGPPGVAFEFPAWSPDGTRVAAVGSGPDGGAVYVFTVGAPGTEPGTAEAAGADPAILYADPDRPPFYLSWSPDGRRITFLTTEADGIALRVAPADAASPAVVVREGAPLYWDWAGPDRLLLHVGADQPDAFVGEVGFDGASLETSAIDVGLFRSPAVTRDGLRRAYVAPVTGTGQALVVESRDASGRHEIPAPGNVAFGFDAAGSSLAFIAGRDERAPPALLPIGPLRLADPRSGAVRTILDDLVVGFFWSPDGRTIAALSVLDPDDPDIDEARGGAGIELTAHRPATDEREARPAVSDPGVLLHLAFVDTLTGRIRSERDIRVSNTFAFQVLPYFDQYALSHRSWSADSRTLALPIATSDSGDRLSALPADGSDPTPIGDAATGFWSP